MVNKLGMLSSRGTYVWNFIISSSEMREYFCELLLLTINCLHGQLCSLHQSTSMHSIERFFFVFVFFYQSKIYRATKKLQLKKTTFLIGSSYSLPLWLCVHQAMHVSEHLDFLSVA